MNYTQFFWSLCKNLFDQNVFVLGEDLCTFWSFPGGSAVKNLPAMQEMQVRFLGQEDPLEEEMATCSSILAVKIPWTKEPSGATVHGVTKNRTQLMLLSSIYILKLMMAVSCLLIKIQFSHSVVSDSLQPHGLQHVRPPCPSPTLGAYSNSCPWS